MMIDEKDMQSEPSAGAQQAVCKGAPELGTACGKCSRCLAAPAPSVSPAAQAPQPQAMPDDFLPSIKHLCVAARTTGGIAGRDDGLCAALDRVEAMLEAVSDPDWRAQASQRSAQATQNEREAFEAWQILQNGYEAADLKRGPNGGYCRVAFNDDWYAWQARAALAAQAPAVPLLAAEHKGMRVDYSGMLMQAANALVRGHKESGLAEMLRQFQGHMTELGLRWYAGDTAVVDELLQLYCVAKDSREACKTTAPTPPASALGERYAALEEAARICDGQAKEPECPERAIYSAAAIRALKSLPPASAAPAAQAEPVARAAAKVRWAAHVLDTIASADAVRSLERTSFDNARRDLHEAAALLDAPIAPAPQCSECKGTGTSEGRDGALVPCLACGRHWQSHDDGLVSRVEAAPVPAAQAFEDWYDALPDAPRSMWTAMQAAWRAGYEAGVVKGQKDQAVHEKHYLAGWRAAAQRAPAALTDEQIDAVWHALPGIKIHNEASAQGMDTQVAMRRAFARAILAAALQPGAKALTDEPSIWELASKFFSAESSYEAIMGFARALLAAEQPSEDKRDALGITQ